MKENTTHRKTIFFIDPQSMRNLSVYDYNLLSEIKDNVYFYCSKYHDYKKLDFIRYKPVFSYNFKKDKLTKATSYIFSLIKILYDILTKQPDVIHVQWFKLPTFDKFFYLFVHKVLKAKIVHTAHNVLPHDTGDKYKSAYSQLYNSMDAIIVHTYRTKEEIHNLFGTDKSKINVIPHGLLKQPYDFEKYQAEKAYMERKFSLKGKFILTALGEQSTYKGTDKLIEVWNSTPEFYQNESCELIIAGENKRFKFEQSIEAKNILRINRKLSNEEFMFFLKISDIYVLPYRNISASGAMFTALTEKIPILVTDVGGLTDPLRIANIGMSIPSIAHLQEGLKYIIDHQEEVRKLKTNQKEWDKIDQTYNWRTISKQTQRLYSDIYLS